MDRYLLYSARYVHQLDKSDPLVHGAKGNTAVTQVFHEPLIDLPPRPFRLTVGQQPYAPPVFERQVDPSADGFDVSGNSLRAGEFRFRVVPA